MLIFSKVGKLTVDDDKMNIILPFSVPQGTKKLIVYYSYSPKLVEDERLALQYLEEGKKKYKTDFSFDEFKEVKNHITLSFDECGKYRGACHRQQNEMTVIIAENDSTPGIENRKIKSGEWDIVLNVHFIGCDVDYSISVEGESE